METSRAGRRAPEPSQRLETHQELGAVPPQMSGKPLQGSKIQAIDKASVHRICSGQASSFTILNGWDRSLFTTELVWHRV